MSEEKDHYTKAELEEFKEIILKKLAEARADFNSLQENLASSAESASDSHNYTEYGNELVDKENNELQLMRVSKHIESLERAMLRIENGTYGFCKITGKLIPKERLRAVPHTETSIEAKQGHK